MFGFHESQDYKNSCIIKKEFCKTDIEKASRGINCDKILHQDCNTWSLSWE